MDNQGETDLAELLKQLKPELGSSRFVFCTTPTIPSSLSPWAIITEEEGKTLILTIEQADAERLSYHVVFRCITLHVHSSLLAVGPTATISRLLAKAGISANVVAGYYHDHVFVPEARSRKFMRHPLERIHDRKGSLSYLSFPSWRDHEVRRATSDIARATMQTALSGVVDAQDQTEGAIT